MQRTKKCGNRLKLFSLLVVLLFFAPIFLAYSIASVSFSSNASVKVSSNEILLTASVTVKAPMTESYASMVVKSSKVTNPGNAAGAPDLTMATMRFAGSMELELDANVPVCSTVSLWVSADSLPHTLEVYTSQNGKKWIYAGACSLTQTAYSRYDISGQFGDVRYVKVAWKNGNHIGQINQDALLVNKDAKDNSKTGQIGIDAVCVKGDDALR